MYVITALIFGAPSELISPIFGPGFNLICPKADWHMFSTCVWVCLPLTYLFTFLSAWVEQAYSFRIFSSAESLFHASVQLSSLTTPPRLWQISKKNWRERGSHFWHPIYDTKSCWKYSRVWNKRNPSNKRSPWKIWQKE